ncbi:MAG: beta-eliminating lyase-related protein, partial [Gemmataceae bacterium]
RTHAETVFQVAAQIDGPKHEYCGLLLTAKSPAARRTGIVPGLPADRCPAVLALLDDPDEKVRSAAAAFFRLPGKSAAIPDADWSALFEDKSVAKRLLVTELAAERKADDDLPRLGRRLNDPDEAVKTSAGVGVVRIVTGLTVRKEPPDQATLKLILGLTDHPTDSVRAAAVRFHTRPEAGRAVPPATWLRWLDDKSAAVRAEAVTALPTAAAADPAVGGRLKKLRDDPSSEVRAAIQTSLLGLEPTNQLVSRLAAEPTIAVARVKLKTVLDILVKKNALTDGFKKRIADSPTLRQFKFDPFKDVYDLTLVFRGRDDDLLLLRGEFERAPKGQVKLDEFADQGLTAAAVRVSDNLLAASQTAQTLDEVLKPKPAAKAAGPLPDLIPKDDRKYLAWVVARWPEEWTKASLLEQIGIDGARFANAVAAAGASPSELTWRAGVDIMSFGATKGGALGAEAVVVFSDELRDDIERLRKRTGHLLSKQRFASAQFNAWLHDGAWLSHADHANQGASRLAHGLTGAGVEIVYPVEANIVFALIDHETDVAAREAGAGYYIESSPPGDDRKEARLVTSWSTTADEVDRFVAAVARPL